jgi:hypothetical protein
VRIYLEVAQVLEGIIQKKDWKTHKPWSFSPGTLLEDLRSPLQV